MYQFIHLVVYKYIFLILPILVTLLIFANWVNEKVSHFPDYERCWVLPLCLLSIHISFKNLVQIIKSRNSHSKINFLKNRAPFFIFQICVTLQCRHYLGSIFNFEKKKKAGCSQGYLPFFDSYCFPDLKTKRSKDFPGGPMVKTPCSQCKRPEFDPWLGN